MTLPATYKAGIVRFAKGPLVMEELPLRLPAAGDVLVKVIALGLCHSDVNIMRGDFGG